MSKVEALYPGGDSFLNPLVKMFFAIVCCVRFHIFLAARQRQKTSATRKNDKEESGPDNQNSIKILNRHLFIHYSLSLIWN